MKPKRIRVHTSTSSLPPAPSPERLLIGIFFCSGAAALVFEVVWLYQCGLVFGNSVWATSLVLAAFMAGLAVGGGLVGRLGSVTVSSTMAYAIAEALVAVAGTALTLTLPSSAAVLAPLFRPVAEILWLTNTLRLITAFLMLMVPCIAMGVTLPLLVAAVAQTRQSFGPALGRLYGWNTFGAVVGVVGAEFVLIPAVGIRGSGLAAGALSLGCAVLAGTLAFRYRRPVDRRVEVLPASGSARSVRLLIAAALSGASLLGFEVVAFRFLSMFVLNSAHAMSLMLATVLAGIALGSLLASRWLRRHPEAVRGLPGVAFAACVVTVSSYAGFRYGTGDASQFADWNTVALLAVRLMMPTALVSGLLFTFQGAALRKSVDTEARTAGLLTLANTLGGAGGALAAGFLLLPWLGMESSFFVLSTLYLAVGLLLIPLERPRRTRLAVHIAFGAAPAALVLVLFPFGLMREHYFPRSARPFLIDGAAVVEALESPTATTFYVRKEWMGQPEYHRLITNGFSMTGTTILGQRYMRFFAYWPLVLRDQPLTRALLIGYGAGETAGALVDIKSLQAIDILDTSPDILALSNAIYQGRRNPLSDARVRVHVEDGRYFLQTSKALYDVITAEPPPPRVPGAVSLYTQEHFQLIHDRLAEGGVVTYWLPMHDALLVSSAKAIVRGFCDVFSDCSLWGSTPLDWMLVGSRGIRGPVSDARFSAPWRDSDLALRLREVAFEQPEQIGATFLADSSQLRELTGGALALTDDYPRRLLPLYASLPPQRMEAFLGIADPARARRAFEMSPYIAAMWPSDLRLRTLDFFAHQQSINRILRDGPMVLRHIDDLHFLLTSSSTRTLPLWALASFDAQVKIAQTHNDGSGAAEYVLAKQAFAERNYHQAEEYLRLSKARGLTGPTLEPLRVYAFCLMGESKTAQALADTLQPPVQSDELYFWRWISKNFGIVPPTHRDWR